MAVVYSTAVKTARMTAVRDQIDGGAGAGKIQIAGAGGFGTLLAEITLGDPCGTVSGDVLTLSGFPRSDTSADNTGTATQARIVDSANTVCVSGLTVGAGTGDINLDSTSITAGQTVTLNSATITHAA